MNCPENKLSTNTSQFKSDIVFLVDLVTEHSSKVQLVTVEELRTEFLERAPNQKMLTEEEAKTEIDTIPYKEKELRNSADDSPEGKERRRLISRRRMLHSLFNGELSVRDLEKQEGEPAELREVTPEYFDEVYAEALKGPNNIEEFESWDGKRYVHFLPLLSSSFARLMSAQTEARLLLDKADDIAAMIQKDGSWGVHAQNYLLDRVQTAKAYIAKAQQIIDKGGYTKVVAK